MDTSSKAIDEQLKMSDWSILSDYISLLLKSHGNFVAPLTSCTDKLHPLFISIVSPFQSYISPQSELNYSMHGR